jgi:cytochrome c-type biogenesis protein CcmH/NrfG
MQDYYETLQVHPKADGGAIQAAYERLRQRYDPAKLEGAADELVEMARKRRDEIDRAYAMLNDPLRRANYDREVRERNKSNGSTGTSKRVVAASPYAAALMMDEALDFRPLPPARRQERPPDFNAQPVLPQRRPVQHSGRQVGQRGPILWLPMLLVAAVTCGVLVVSLLLAGTGPQPAPQTANTGPQILGTPAPFQATPTTAELVSQYDQQVDQARLVTQNAPQNPNAWINYGNALYDSVMVVREQQPDSSNYIERLPRWLEASNAYREALKLQPGNIIVQTDLAQSLCYYGAGINDASYVSQGLAEAQAAVQAAPQEARPLMSLGICLTQANPPQTQEAIGHWQKALTLVPADTGFAFQLQRLIEQHSK